MKNIFIKLSKVAKTQNPSGGFTLIELLVAASITTIVVGLTGFGVVAITSKNKEAKAESERRVELNRALDFIADEVRQAKPISTNAAANLSIAAPGFNSLNKTPVLTLQIPGVSQRVIYYTESSSSPWLGPKVISRWGPNFGADGNYTVADATNEPPVGCSSPADCNPTNWKYEPLVDLIIDTTPASATTCPGLTGWTANPSVDNGQGFTACVDPNGRIADIRISGKLTDAYNNSRPPLIVSTKAFARPYKPTFTTSSSVGSGAGTGTVTFTQPSTAYFEVLGGSLNCGPGGSVIPTTTTINFTNTAGTTTSSTVSSSTKALNLSAPEGSTVTVTGATNPPSGTGSCTTAPPSPGVPGSLATFTGASYNSTTNQNTQVLTLRDGATPPLFRPLAGQPPIDAFLTKYLDPATGKVKLAENQVIFLFELGTTTNPSAAYDMQDLVVLATITPKAQ